MIFFLIEIPECGERTDRERDGPIMHGSKSERGIAEGKETLDRGGFTYDGGTH